MTSEVLNNYFLFEYSPRITTTQSFPEVTVTIAFKIGLKPPQSFSGHTYIIKNDDKDVMEAESYFEAAVKAWKTKYGLGGVDEKTAVFVKHSLENKWLELQGEILTSKKLKF